MVTTIYGKVPVGVANIAKKYHVPVMAFGAILAEGSWRAARKIRKGVRI